MKQYLDLLQKILAEGTVKESGRANMPPTIGLSNGIIRMDMADGFPLLTTKKMFWKGVVHELLWFLRGETNIKYLVDNGVNVWDKDAYGWYKKIYGEYGIPMEHETLEAFVKFIKENPFKMMFTRIAYKGTPYYIGDLGKVYGYQWRNQNGVDQVSDVLTGLKENPYSRYHIIDGWNKADFAEMALPPCHLLYQFIVRPLSTLQRLEVMKTMSATIGDLPTGTLLPDIEGNIIKILNEKNVPKFHLDLNMYQRSCDTFLGVPFNIASMSVLLMLFAKASNMVPGIATWIGGDTHVYVPHVDIVKEQLTRTPHKLPTLEILPEINSLSDILSMSIEDFRLNDYVCEDKLNAKLYTGLKEDWGDE